MYVCLYVHMSVGMAFIRGALHLGRGPVTAVKNSEPGRPSHHSTLKDCGGTARRKKPRSGLGLCECPAAYTPCSCTSPSRQRRRTLASPGRRSGCLIRPRCTRTGCTVGTANLCYRRESRRRGASRVCPQLIAPPGRRGPK